MDKPPVEVSCVCGFCGERSADVPIIEFNFKDQSIYYACGKCNKTNSMELKNTKVQPYPRARIMR